MLLSIGEAVLVVDRAGAVVLANAAVERLFGAAGAEIAPDDGEGQRLAEEETPPARAARGAQVTGFWVLDYLLVHEMAHLQHSDHGAGFHRILGHA